MFRCLSLSLFVLFTLFAGLVRADEPLPLKGDEVQKVNVVRMTKQDVAAFKSKYDGKEVTFKGRIEDVYEDRERKVYYFDVSFHYQLEQGGELEPEKVWTTSNSLKSKTGAILPILMYLEGPSKGLRERVIEVQKWNLQHPDKPKILETTITGTANVMERFIGPKMDQLSVSIRIEKAKAKVSVK